MHTNETCLIKPGLIKRIQMESTRFEICTNLQSI